MPFVNYNGKILPADNPQINFNNRSLRYGDGLFETLCVTDGKILYLKDHLSRLLCGMKALKMKIPAEFTNAGISGMIHSLISVSEEKAPLLKIRFQVFRSGNGLYTPLRNEVEYFMECISLRKKNYKKVELLKSVEVFREHYLYPTKISRFKTCNSLFYILASIYKKEHKLQEVLLLDNKENLAECSSSNLFWFNMGRLFTPSLETGCIEGVMRTQVFKAAVNLGIKIKEVKMPLKALTAAQCVFCTNVTEGIRIISGIHSWRLSTDDILVKKILKKIMENEAISNSIPS